MIPTSFKYKRVNSIDEALSAMNDESKLLAGGHSLIPAMKLRLNQPELLVDISDLDELKGIKDRGDHITIGAGTTHGAIAQSELVRSACHMLSDGASRIGDRQVRNMGTLGGSIAHADPAADWPGILIAADASISLRNYSGERKIKAEDFFLGFYETALEDNEIITEIAVPKFSSSTRTTYVKFVQPASRFAIVGCAIKADINGGKIENCRVAFTGVSDTAFLDKGVSDALNGKDASISALTDVLDKAAAGKDVMSDHYASEEYRAHLAKVYLKKALSNVIG